MTEDDLLASYRFELPPEAVAQRPAAKRDASRLLLLDRDGGRRHCRFVDLPSLLSPGDLLVRNDALVIPARLLGRRSGGGATEFLLVREEESQPGEVWHCLARPASHLRPGSRVVFGDGEMEAVVLEKLGGGRLLARFSEEGGAFRAKLDSLGQIPLPPYIRRPGREATPEDRERYQTTYARTPGAVAAPTAGLHFTSAIEAELAARGVEIAHLTLKVGPGTFRPIKADDLADHRMDEEYYRIPPETAAAVRRAREGGGRVIAVGSTSVRALESSAIENNGVVAPGEAWTSLFIRPGFPFRAVDGMVTNFHLPESSLLVMVAAMAGRATVLDAYREAVGSGYRFYSYGDAMLVWRR